MWGSATSAHQVEGQCTNNNWFAFESAVDERGMSRMLNGQRAGMACDHWNRYREDVALMKSLSLNAYRFSIEWSKVEPEEGLFDEAAVEHYSNVIDELILNGIRPVVTLHHFTNPLWFERRGGFLASQSPEVFERFVRFVVGRLGKVLYWCTINEPTVYAINGYVTREFPPAMASPLKAMKVIRNMLHAHARAYRSIKEIQGDALVGPALSIFPLTPFSLLNPLDILASWIADHGLHRGILRFITTGRSSLVLPRVRGDGLGAVPAETADFVGLNYYTRFHLRVRPWRRPAIVGEAKSSPDCTTDMGWEMYPEGLRTAIRLIGEFTDKPILVTENGIADAADTRRGRFITDHVEILASENARGADVRGYFYWSLLDNFEWAFGYTKRFGLFHVDFSTQRRNMRASGMEYMHLIRDSLSAGE